MNLAYNPNPKPMPERNYVERFTSKRRDPSVQEEIERLIKNEVQLTLLKPERRQRFYPEEIRNSLSQPQRPKDKYVTPV